jgi:diacylglycerol kinase (ATP)
MDKVTLEPRTSIVTVANAPMMGHNLLVAPDARMDDGLLDVAVYDGMGDADLIKHLKGIANGGGEPVPSYKTRRVRVTSDTPLPANADDKEAPPGRIAIEIEVVPRALSVIVGNGIGLSVPVEATPGASAEEA